MLCSGYAVKGYDIEAITVHHETAAATDGRGDRECDCRPTSLPRRAPRVPAAAERKLHAARRRRHQQVREEYSDGSRGDFQVAADGKFAFAVPLPDGPGIYTVVVWVRPHGTGVDAIPASDVSINVDAAARIAVSGTR